MEKGNSKASKSSSADSKNKDVVNKHLRLPRVKENTSPRPDSRRKPNPQRNRELFDKRPKIRTGGFYEKYRSEVADEVLGEVTKHGSKKTNLNHLLNFTVAPLDSWTGSGRRPVYNRTKLPKYNKELFLQANCQFVARDNEDYSVHEKNPDILVEWSRIEEIRFPCHEIPLCPICLYVPVAAKITRCGHIFCWPCMLHYLSLTDKTWQKCPICFEAVHGKDLKSVSVIMQRSFGVGDEIAFYLMKREKGSLLSIPITEQKLHNSICTVQDVDYVTRYQKLLLASSVDVEHILDRERMELNEAYQNEKDTPEVCFVEQAIQLLNEREHNLKHDNEVNKDAVAGNINIPNRKKLTSVSSNDTNDDYLEIHENFKGGTSPGMNATSAYANESDAKAATYFYQAEDGQHIYLHNMNIRMLIKEYGSLEFSLPVIKAKIVEIESVTLTEVLRKKLRYLQHLPLTCEFQIVELDFSHIVSRSILELFEGDIQKRKTQRHKKAREERRREKMIEQEENKKIGKYPKATYNLNSIDQFPAYNPEDFLSLSPPKNGSGPCEDVNSNVNWPCASASSDNDNYPSEFSCSPVASFAQMLKDTPKPFTQIPKERSGTRQAPPPSADDEDYVPVPEYRQTFGDAIQIALDAIALNEAPDKTQASSRKKKGKKQLLFTTSMCRTK